MIQQSFILFPLVIRLLVLIISLGPTLLAASPIPILFHAHQPIVEPPLNSAQQPIPVPLQERPYGEVKTLSATEVAAFKPYALYAATGYCDPSLTRGWTCGANCKGNSHFIPVASGGDGADVQFWFVGIDTKLETIIVGHEGTDPAKILPLLTILDFSFEDLDQELFPGISPLLQVHSGFRKSHAKTAFEVLEAVEKALTMTTYRKVTTVGHSLGAAIAILDSVYLPLFIPNITVHTVGYGTPRVGNWAFAQHLDQHANITRVNNRRDVVPILPGQILGYQHPGGERHIRQDGSWVSCPGHDNEDERCSTGRVDDIFEMNLGDHDGPYDGVEMTC